MIKAVKEVQFQVCREINFEASMKVLEKHLAERKNPQFLIFVITSTPSARVNLLSWITVIIGIMGLHSL